MRVRVIFALALLAAGLPLAGCSYSTDFVVVNKSGATVEVQFTLKGGPPEGFASITRPWVKATRDLKDDDVAWRQLGAGEVAYDPADGSYRLLLPPSQALRLVKSSNWHGHGDELRDKLFPIETLRIAGAGGSVCYEGKQAQYQFVYQNKNLYTLTYHDWGNRKDGD